MEYKSSTSFGYAVEDILYLIQETDSLFEPPLSNRVELKEYAIKLQQKASLELAYTNEGKPVGMLAYYANDHQSQIAYITFLAVLPEFQGQGIAKILMKKGIQNCQQNKMKEIKVETWEENALVIRFYEKFDFLIKMVVNDRKGANSVKMVKKL